MYGSKHSVQKYISKNDSIATLYIINVEPFILGKSKNNKCNDIHIRSLNLTNFHFIKGFNEKAQYVAPGGYNQSFKQQNGRIWFRSR